MQYLKQTEGSSILQRRSEVCSCDVREMLAGICVLQTCHSKPKIHPPKRALMSDSSCHKSGAEVLCRLGPPSDATRVFSPQGESALQFQDGNVRVKTWQPMSNSWSTPSQLDLHVLLVGEKQHDITRARFCT